MPEERKTIIIKEIQHWKKNHLLPEKYCDFLLALYTEGNTENVNHNQSNPMESTGVKPLHVLIISLNIFLLPVTFIVLYFTQLSSYLQVGFGSLMIVLSYSFYIIVKTKLDFSANYPLFILLVIILFVTSYLSQQLFQNQLIIALIALTQLIIWIGFGLKQKNKLLSIAGIVGFIFCLVYFVS
ncbi:hypothetical protein Pryu01_00564 [Paraliobacillus ryukyuensis]|uniref:Uncharacterized protein n=1 Tax=Paraliobacillus ryukyuensis TaxID=200904 RepID=A0A366EI28_9BACI|nr:hypothetical protein [Paraliobacillus ryukyuensis]RBP01370.1 hypothetical protein DES48_101100 [Paraliobacillus ryukyuensis]